MSFILAVVTAQMPTPTPRIIGGTQVTPFAYPFLARVYDRVASSNSGFCAASLIANDWVLSAAHCFDNRDPSSIHIGIHRDLVWSGSTNEHACAEVIPAAQVICHPTYGVNNQMADYGYDICLVRLSRAITCPDIPKIRLDNGYLWPMDAPAPQNGGRALVIGWGATNSAGTNLATRANQAEVNLYTRAQCRQYYTSGTEVSTRELAD